MAKEDNVMKDQEEAVELMGLDIEEATDCGPESHKNQRKEKIKQEQAEAAGLMGEEIEEATDCGCSAKS